MASIHEAIVAIKKEVGVVAKDGFNQAQRFKFRSIDGIYNSVHSLFAKHGVFTVPRVVQSDFAQYETGKGSVMFRARLLVEYDLVAGDGSREKFGPIAGEGSDSGDKATSKALAMAHKYMLIQALQLQTEDDDPDSQTAPPATRPEQRPPPDRPEDPPAGKTDFGKVRTKLVDSLSKWVEGDKAKAKRIVGFIMPGCSSVTAMDEGKIRAYSLGWWIYRILRGNEKEIVEWMSVNSLPWFDKATPAQLDTLKKYCEMEDAKLNNKAEGFNTHSPDTKDANGEDPF